MGKHVCTRLTYDPVHCCQEHVQLQNAAQSACEEPSNLHLHLTSAPVSYLFVLQIARQSEYAQTASLKTRGNHSTQMVYSRFKVHVWVLQSAVNFAGALMLQAFLEAQTRLPKQDFPNYHGCDRDNKQASLPAHDCLCLQTLT